MPVCSACNENKLRSQFNRRQMKKGNGRKCKQCTSNNTTKDHKLMKHNSIDTIKVANNHKESNKKKKRRKRKKKKVIKKPKFTTKIILKQSLNSCDLPVKLLRVESLKTISFPSASKSTPIYYQCPDDGKEYIIIFGSEDYIYLYDIQKDCYISKYKYPSNIQIWHPNVILNKTENKLYFIDYHRRQYIPTNGSLFTLDLSTSEWEIVCNKSIKPYIYRTYSYFIDNAIHGGKTELTDDGERNMGHYYTFSKGDKDFKHIHKYLHPTYRGDYVEYA
eukprot:199079_1